MNKYQFHFGDYYNDGHGQYITLHCQSPKSESELRNISKKVLEIYPQLDSYKTGGLCIEYGEYHLKWEVIECLIAIDFPFKRMLELCDFDDNQFTSWEEAYDSGNMFFMAEAIGEIWIWFMNAFGAELEIIKDKILAYLIISLSSFFTLLFFIFFFRFSF